MVKIDFDRPGLDTPFAVTGKGARDYPLDSLLGSCGKSLHFEFETDGDHVTPQGRCDSQVSNAWAVSERKRKRYDAPDGTQDVTEPVEQEKETAALEQGSLHNEKTCAAEVQGPVDNLGTISAIEEEREDLPMGDAVNATAAEPAVGHNREESSPPRRSRSFACFRFLDVLADAFSPTARHAVTDTLPPQAVTDTLPSHEATDADLQQAILESTSLHQAKEASATEARERLRQVMDLYNAKSRPVQADGNCQFRALSLQLNGDEEDHGSVRACIVEQLQKEPQRYKDFVHEEYSDYLKRMARDGQWGDNVTLQAASDTLGLEIRILTDQPGAECVEVRPSEVTGDMKGKPLCLSFLSEVHYDAAELLL